MTKSADDSYKTRRNFLLTSAGVTGGIFGCAALGEDHTSNATDQSSEETLHGELERFGVWLMTNTPNGILFQGRNVGDNQLRN